MSGSRSKQAQQSLGIPDGFKVATAFPFKGVNQSASRLAMDDAEFFWLENYVRIGDGNLRTVWDAGASFYTAPGDLTIVYFFWYNIGPQVYVAVFLSDGSAVQIAYPSGTQTTIGPPGIFYVSATPQLPACCQSGTQYLIIGNHNTDNDYWIWDGALLYAAGGIAPISLTAITDGGSGYTSVPSYTVYGGSGSGVVLTPIIAEGSVVALTVVNPGTGYVPGDIVQVAFSGGGSDTSPILEAVVSGSVEFLTLVAGGTGYPTGTYALGFSGGGGGSGATGTFTTSGGAVTSVNLTSGGSNYGQSPVVSFPIPGTGAAITATETAGTISALTITNGGSGYVPGTYPLAFSGGGGAGAAATYTVNASGVVAATTITAPGTGYTGAPTVAIPTGSGASVVASITQGAVTAINIINGGTGLIGTPVLTITGGDGTGAEATATVTAGAISAVTITNAGSGYTTAPAVEVQTGVNNAAAAILDLMPFGVSGVSIETYQSRVWIVYPNQQGKQNNGGTFFVSTPDSLTDFATSDGGDIFVNTDRFLRQQYTFIRQTSNFLYPVGDSSVSVISNVQTGGSPTSTTFSYQNTDPQVGSNWRDSAQDFSNTILFANAFGVYGLYGGSVRKVSAKIDNIFTNAVLPAAGGLTPTSAVANIYSQKLYLLLLTITDPFTFTPRNIMVGWDQANWYIVSQTPGLVMIGTQEVNSNIQAWGTDGTKLYPLFNQPSATLVKVISTKQWGGQQSFMINTSHSIYIDAEDLSVGQAGLTFNGSIDGLGLAVPVVNSVTSALASSPSVSQPIAAPLTFVAPKGRGAMYGAGIGAGVPQVPGTGLGITLATSSPDFSLRNLSLGMIETTAVA